MTETANYAVDQHNTKKHHDLGGDVGLSTVNIDFEV